MSGGPGKKHTRKFDRREYRRNRQCWQQITAEKYEEILAIARSFTKDISAAYDLAQTVVLRLLKYCPAPLSIVNFDAYIFATTRHAWIDSQRPHREISFTELEQTSAAEIPVLDRNLNNVLARRDLELITAHLHLTDPKLLLTIILLRAGEKLPDIAERLGEPVRTTRFRYYRWRRQVGEKF